MRKLGVPAVAVGILLGLSGCIGQSQPSVVPQAGQYEGFYGQQSVTATLKQISSTELTLTFSSQTWGFKIDASGGIEVQNVEGTEKLSPSPSQSKDDSDNSDQQCETANTSDRVFRLCWSAEEIHWSESAPDGSQLANLDLAKTLSGQMPVMETPQSYALEDLISRAKKRNFQTVVAFKKMLVAKDDAVNADMDLMPHATSQDLFNILSGSLFTELKSIGDLAPFLLPSHWFRASAAGDMAAADRDAWEIMDLDGVNYVESFAYASARDAQALEEVGAERAQVAALRDFVKGEEPSGIVPLGSSDVLTALLSQIDLSSSDLETLQSNELSALAQASGFYNPQAITGVAFKQDANAPWAGNPLNMDFASASKLAVGVSIELRQMNDLIAWGKNEAKAKIFDWMDPSGDSSGGVGLGLPSYIEAGQDTVNLMESQEDLAQSDLLNDVQKTINDLDQESSDYQIASQGVATEQRIVLEQTENLKLPGSEFDMSILVTALQGEMDFEISQIDAEYGYQLALSRLNRLLCQGAYADPN